MACDPSSPRASPLFRRVCDNLRWFPFVFILSLILYAYLVLAVSIGVIYTLVKKHDFIKGFFQLLISTLLAGGASWSFVVAVFKHPGSPPASSGDQERGYALYDEGEDGGSRRSSATEQRHQGDDDDEEEQGESAGLLGGERGARDEDGASAPLLSAPLPGQPQLPARSGRQQLTDLLHLTSHARTSASVSNGGSGDGTIRPAADIWVKSTGESRWCAKCAAPKPDRCHHCSSCGRCVLRMDHHCPWLASRCIGLRNHKAFFLFLAYTALLCVYAAQESARALIDYVGGEVDGFESSPITWAVVLFMGFIFGCTLLPFAGYHAYLILKNRTTLEAMEGSGRVRLRARRDPRREKVQDRLRRIAAEQRGDGSDEAGPSSSSTTTAAGRRQHGDAIAETGTSPSPTSAWRSDEHLTREERRALKKANRLNVYDVGIGRNWRQIMGDDPWYWFVPVGEPTLNGTHYLVHQPTLQELDTLTASIRTRDAHPRPRPSSSSSSAPAASSGFETDWRTPGQRTGGAHGEMEWGDAPRKSEWGVLYGVDSSDEEEEGPQHVLGRGSEDREEEEEQQRRR